MNERYTRVFSLPEHLYATGAPVVISAGALLKDNQTGKVLAQLKLTNIQYKKIKAIKVKLFPLDTMGQSLGEAIDYQYLDLQLTRDGDWGSKIPIPFPDATARAFEAEVITVAFADNTAWNTDSSPWEPIPDSIPLHRQFDNLIIEQLRLEQSGTCQFVVQEHKDLWLCTCGAVNHDGEARCHDCGKQLSQLHPLDFEALTERANLRLAEEARQAAEEKAARDAAAEAAKKKTAKIFKIAIPVVCAAIAFVILLNAVIIPNSKYNKAVSLMEAGQYEDAIAAFYAMNGYKDSIQQIENCEQGIINLEFAEAEALMAAGDYDRAIAIYESLTNYEGSAEGIAAAEEGKLAVAYHAAEILAENGETAKAAIAFGKMAGYKDASEQSHALWNTFLVHNTVDSGHFHTVSLQADGKVLAVGNNEYGQTNVQNWTAIKSVSAGACFTIGLKTDGSLVSTGINNEGQCNIQGWSDIQSISAGAYHTVGLKSDGTVVAVGYNEKDNRCEVDDWKDIVAISGGQYHTVGLKFDGTVSAVGYNFYDQCNVSGWQDVIAISAGSWHTVALKVDGTVVAIGNNEYGQCDVSGWRDIIAVSAGKVHTVGLKSDGTVVATGHNKYGQCDVGSWKNILTISAENCHTVGLRADGAVAATGSNDYGQCDVGNWKEIKLPN